MRQGDDKGGSGPGPGDRYRLLLEAITDYAIYMLDRDGRIVSWNPGARRLKGYDEAEILGHHFSDFYTDEDKAIGLPARALSTAAREGRFENEGWRRRKDGTLFWAHVVIDPVLDPTGELVGFAKITRDLTERRLAEQELRRSQEQFRILVQGVADYALYMLDPEGLVSSWNVGAERIKGYRPQDIIGQHFSRFHTDADRAAGEPARSLEIAKRVGRFEKEGWRVRKDGTRFWANVVIDAIRDDSGKLLGFAKITRDITERRNAQLALEEARDALFQARKLEALGRLTGGIAHDFNNLLAAVLGSLDLLRKRVPPDPRLTPLIENAIQGAERGASLTQRMLAFARRQDLKLTPTDLQALVRGMSGLLAQATGPAVEIETRFPLSLSPAMTDSNQLEAALLNLVVNARDALPEGGKITISAREIEIGANKDGLVPGRYVCLAVTDNGQGMDADTLARAGEPFFTTKGVGKGTGLGLPMVLGLSQQSGGRFLLRSQRGEGTTAEIWLPAAEAVAIAADPLTDVPIAAPPVRPVVVLAVDDDRLVLMNTRALLEDLGHTVLEANDGLEALEILGNMPVDLLITDQAMPNMTGTELAGLARSRWPGLPIILATGYAELPASSEAELHLLGKPFTQMSLQRAVSHVLGTAPEGA